MVLLILILLQFNYIFFKISRIQIHDEIQLLIITNLDSECEIIFKFNSGKVISIIELSYVLINKMCLYLLV